MQNQLNFSRDMEREADRIGFGVMTQGGFAPQGAPWMFEKLQYASRLNDNGPYPYLRSYPLTSERISDMQGRFQFRHGRGAAGSAGDGPRDDCQVCARVLTRPGVDVLRLWIESASSGEFGRKARRHSRPARSTRRRCRPRKCATTRTARTRSNDLGSRTAEDPAAAKQARWLNCGDRARRGRRAQGGCAARCRSRRSGPR